MRTNKFSLLSVVFFVVILISCNNSNKKVENIDTLKKGTKIDTISENLPSRVKIKGTNVNVRSEATRSSVVLFQLNTGDECELLQKGPQETINGNTNFWYQIKYKNKTGWVFGQFIDFNNKTSTNNENISERIISESFCDGIYMGIEITDRKYFIIKDDKGNLQKFVLNDHFPGEKYFLKENTAINLGKKCRVNWQVVEIKDKNKSYEITKLVSAKLLQ